MKFSTTTTTPTPANTTARDIEHDPTSLIGNGENKMTEDNSTEDGTDLIASNSTTHVKTTGRWTKIAFIIMASTIITLLALTIHFYKESQTSNMTLDVTNGMIDSEHEVMRNTTSTVGCGMEHNKTTIETYTNDTDPEGDGNRMLQRCLVMRTPIVGRGSSAYTASYNCFTALYYLYCSTSCPVSYNAPIYSRRQWYVQCYCGLNGQYDVY